MTEKQFVLKTHPNAFVEEAITFGKRHFIIWHDKTDKLKFNIGSGIKKKEAWINAKHRILSKS